MDFSGANERVSSAYLFHSRTHSWVPQPLQQRSEPPLFQPCELRTVGTRGPRRPCPLPPDFDRSFNPIIIREADYARKITTRPWIFRPSYGPGELLLLSIWRMCNCKKRLQEIANM